MNAKKDFVALSNELITLARSTANVNSTVLTWWVNRLNGVIRGTDKGLTNPQGYFLNGIAPTSNRCQANVKELFVESLLAGYMGNAEKMCRTVNPFSQRMMEKGLFESFARKESQYGTLEGRLAGAVVSHAPLSQTAKKQAVKQVGIVEESRVNKNRAAFENASLSIAAILEKYSKPVLAKQAKPEATKPATDKGSKIRAA